MSNAHRGTPKNIVLLSDGTGNSSAKLMKTNVWRMYEAVDLTKGDQVACYDNGVGTSSFKPFAVLGGALGWGLKRNVRHLYTYACSHYVDASDDRDADRLFGFGFSRGAFTMRVLMGLIESQGLITGAKGQELESTRQVGVPGIPPAVQRDSGTGHAPAEAERCRSSHLGAAASTHALFRGKEDHAASGVSRPLGHGGCVRSSDRRDDARLGSVGLAALDVRAQASGERREGLSCTCAR